MCGRFTLRAPAKAVAKQFRVAEAPLFEARYNIAPTQQVTAVRAADGARQLVTLRWGLIPPWAKERSIGNRLINARADTVATKPAFRSAFRKRRCLIPADGFYEWQKIKGGKQPYHIHMKDGSLFAFAGLWERWHNPEDGEEIESCTILTTDANDLMRPLHDRMPVILPEEVHDAWLDPAQQQPEDVMPLVRPFPSEALETTPVSAYVNNARHEGPECLAPAG
jgi:putative SOS response-associated peptidase YedK